MQQLQYMMNNPVKMDQRWTGNASNEGEDQGTAFQEYEHDQEEPFADFDQDQSSEQPNNKNATKKTTTVKKLPTSVNVIIKNKFTTEHTDN